MLKTFFIKTVVATLLVGIAGAGAAAARQISTQAQNRVIQQEHVQAEVRNELPLQLREQLGQGPNDAIIVPPNIDCEAAQLQDRDRLQDQAWKQAQDRIRIAPPGPDCDGTPDQDRDRIQDQIHQSQSVGAQGAGNSPMKSGGAGNGGQP